MDTNNDNNNQHDQLTSGIYLNDQNSTAGSLDNTNNKAIEDGDNYDENVVMDMEMGESDEELAKHNGNDNNSDQGNLSKEEDQHDVIDSRKEVHKEIPNRYSYFNTDDAEDSYRNIIHVFNISSSATLEQLSTLFKYIGIIRDIKLYEYEQTEMPATEPSSSLKVCFVDFEKSNCVLMAQHLTNTVFIDRALVVLPYKKSYRIPDKQTALKITLESEHLNKFNSGYSNHLVIGVCATQALATTDHRLSALGLQHYPQLPVNTEPARIEEIRRTVYVGNLDSTITPDQVMNFFNDIGEIKYIRLAGDDTQPTRFAFVEFNHQASVANALLRHGFVLGSRGLKINHSNNAIVKPPAKIEPLTQDEILKRNSIRDYSTSRSDRDRRSHHSSSRYDRDRTRDRYRHDRRAISPRRRSRSRDKDSSSRRRRSRSRGDSSRRSRSREKTSRGSKRSGSRSRRSRTKSSERSSRVSRHHHKSSRK